MISNKTINRKKKKDSISCDKLVDWTNSWYRFYADHIERARNFLTFLYVDQWDVDTRQMRQSLFKPVLQFNKLTPVIRGILGEQRNNSPALTVRGGDKTKQSDVDLREMIIRQVHYNSDSDIVYQIASKHALECGWGAARVTIEYEKGNTFDRCLYIRPITDFQAAFWDPCAQLGDKSDGDFCGVYIVMSKDHFKKIYPHIENPQSAPSSGTNYYLRWTGREDILVCEIYYKDYYNKTIYELSDGKVVDKKELDEIMQRQENFMLINDMNDVLDFEPIEVINERSIKDYKIKHVKFIQNQILEETDWPGSILPIVYFEGDSTVIDGERIPLPYIQDGIDQQKLINYIGSETAYAILRARKETVIGTPEMFNGFEEEWQDSGKVQGALRYNLDKGEKPQFINPPVLNEALINLHQVFIQDLNQSLGRFEESRGENSNAISGRAINARQRAANNPVNLYNDNWQRGIEQIGKILLDLIPHVYDRNRTIIGMGKDNVSMPIEINRPGKFVFNFDGEGIDREIENDMSIGEYDVEIRVDGSYDAQRAEAMGILIDLARVNPAISNLIPDLLAENSGLENTQKLIERFKTLLPPDILAKEEGKPLPPPPPPDPLMEFKKKELELKDKQIAIENRKADLQQQEILSKQQDMVLQEQKLMLESEQLGLDHAVSFAKANAEIEKAEIDRDTARIRHRSNIHQHLLKDIRNRQ